jgi:hypothetical protein
MRRLSTMAVLGGLLPVVGRWSGVGVGAGREAGGGESAGLRVEAGHAGEGEVARSGVEGVEVHRRPGRERIYLRPAQPLPRGPLDRSHRVDIERSGCRRPAGPGNAPSPPAPPPPGRRAASRTGSARRRSN